MPCFPEQKCLRESHYSQHTIAVDVLMTEDKEGTVRFHLFVGNHNEPVSVIRISLLMMISHVPECELK